MRLVHAGVEAEHLVLDWFFRTIPAPARTLQLVVCGSILTSHNGTPPQRRETTASTGHRTAPVKPMGDLLVSGHAWPGGGRSVTAMRAGIAMGSWRKELAVFGDRIWELGATGIAATRPLPFTSMPITYDRAFGGPGSRSNPDGRGMGGGDRGARLPNIEHPDRQIAQPTARPEPAGFGPLGPYWRPRADHLGTFDRDWLAREWPGMPADCNPRHWNEAPVDQQFPGWFRGDERISVFNMHPDHPRMDLALPGRRARAFIARTDGELGEIPLRLDTIGIDMDAGTTEAIWRGAIPVSSPRMREIAFLFTMAEDLANPLPEAACRALFERTRRDTYPTPEERAATEAADQAEQDRADAERATDDDHAGSIAQAEAALAEAEQQAAAARTEPRPAPATTPDHGVDALNEIDPAKAAELAALLQEADAIMAEEDAPKWTRQSVAAAHGAGISFVGADLSGLDLDSLDLSGAAMQGANLAGTLLARTSLQDADLAGADLSECRASEADFTNALMAGATLAGAHLAGARLDGANLAQANLSAARAPRASLDGAHGVGVTFALADLSGASFRQADLPGADFYQATLSDAVFDGATLTQAGFSEASAPGASFAGATMVNLRAHGADFRGAMLAGVNAPRSVWEKAQLTSADFSRAVLSWAILTEAVLDGADLDRCWLDDAKFDEASLRGAKLTRAKLVRASLEWTDLTNADLSGSNLWNAGIFKADLRGTRLDGCFLKGTLLAL